MEKMMIIMYALMEDSMSDSTSLFHYQKEVSQLGKNGCTSYTV
jgi:hypothetical protein